MKDNAFIYYEVLRCSEETRKVTDPECATEDAINEWTQHKSIGMRVINNKINFESFVSTSYR